MSTSHSSPIPVARLGRDWLVYVVAALLGAGLIAYALTRAFVWDEGFHLLAAQMIEDGKRPYLDFCFPQTPLNAYWNAGLMRIFGHGWRITHFFAASFVTTTVFLVAQYTLKRMPHGTWRLPCALAAVLYLAINPIVVEFGPIAQAYGIALFTGFLAFRLWTWSNERHGPLLPFLSGLAASTAAGSTLLAAPIAPILFFAYLIWSAQRRWELTFSFLVGVVIPFIPVLWLFAHDPHVVFFNIIQYQAVFRRYHWENPGPHDFDVLTSWVESVQTFLLAVSAIATLSALRRWVWDAVFRRELLVCTAIVLSMVAYISMAHPTFSRYYIVAIPFLSVLASPGVFVVGSKLLSPARPWLAAACLAFVLGVSIVRMLFNDRDSATFDRYVAISKKIAEVTPPHAEFFADEHVYFMLHLRPPPGLEFSYSHKLELPKSEELRLHIVSEKELQAQLKAGRFATYETCKDDQADDWGIEKIFSKKADVSDCSVFWGYHR